MSPKKRGPKKKSDPRDAENAKLRRENARLKKKVEQYELALEAQKKLAELWGVTLTGDNDDNS